MSYSIYFDQWGNLDKYTNLTFETISSYDEELSRTEAFEDWFEDRYGDRGLNLEDIRNGDIEDEDLRIYELADEFRDSDAYYDLEESYAPMCNFVHILEHKPSENDILMIEKYTSSVVVVYLNEVDTYALALTGCGMDLSDNLELAYYFSDGRSPIIAQEFLSLSEEAQKICLFCRQGVKKHDWVSNYAINSFIKAGYKDEEK